MKFLFLVLFLGVAQATIFKGYGVDKDNVIRGIYGKDRGLWNWRSTKIPVDKNLVVIQKDILKLLNNINHLSTDKVILDISKTYKLENHVDQFVDKKVILDLIRLYRTEGFLNRDKVFNILDDIHRHEVKIITKVLISAKNLVEFFKVASWLRNHVNGGVFTYALYVAVRNRDDCVGVVLPPLYEVQPMKFFKNKVIQNALQLKMQGQIFDEQYARTLGVEKVDKNVYVLKTDYTGVNINNQGENKLTYFTEDIGLNNNYFMAHITTPFWIDYKTIPTTRHTDYRRGEWVIFMNEQLLARYYLERLSNGLGEIPRFKWNLPIKTGYNPSLRHHNGLEYSVRPNNYVVNTVENLWDLKTFKDYERRIRDAIDRGYLWGDDGKIISLRNPEDIDKLGNLLQCNGASTNNRYIHGVFAALRLLGNRRVIDDNTGVTPSVLENYSTMLRDPMFYQLLKRIVHNVHKFNKHLRPYDFDELFFKGVTIKNVKVDKLVTYFDTFDVDITNVVNRDVREMMVNKDEMILKTRQVRLNHVPFNVDIDVTSDITTDCIVKIFLGPKYNSLNRKIRLDDNRKNFLLLDRHTTTLRKGLNTITRNSRLFNLVTDDVQTTRKLITRVDNCLKGVEECFAKEIKHSVLIPDRLVLPKGTPGGMTFQLFVTVTPTKGGQIYDTTDKYDSQTITTLRYPLDRKIIHVKEFLTVDNFFLRDVVIFNKEGIVDKYTGEVKDKLISGSESSESVETLGLKKIYSKKNMYGRKIDSMERIRGLDSGSVENIYGKRFNTRKNLRTGTMDSMENILGRKLNKMDRIMGKRMTSMEDSDMSDSRMNSKENILGRKMNKMDKILGKRINSMEDIDILGKRMNSRARNMNLMEDMSDSRMDSRENIYGRKMRNMNKIMGMRTDSRENVFGRRMTSMEDLSRLSLEDSRGDVSKELLMKRLMKQKMMRGSEENMSDLDMKIKMMTKKGMNMRNKYY